MLTLVAVAPLLLIGGNAALDLEVRRGLAVVVLAVGPGLGQGEVTA